MNIKHAYGTVTGAAHRNARQECQDKIKILDKNGVMVIALADGIDHKEHSRISSGVVVNAVANLITERFDDLLSAGDMQTNAMIITNIMQELGKTELPLFSIASTLSYVAVKNNRFIAGQIGNGLILRMEETCSVLFKPQTETENETAHYVTDLDANDHLKIYKGVLMEPFGFLLMSDGARPSLYFNNGSISPVCGTLMEWLREYDQETVREALVENLEKYFTQNSEDDITVAMMVSYEAEQIPEQQEADGSENSVQNHESQQSHELQQNNESEQKKASRAPEQEPVNDAEKPTVNDAEKPAADLPETDVDSEEDAQKPEMKNGSRMKYTIMILIALVLCGIGMVLFFSMSNDAEPESPSKIETEASGAAVSPSVPENDSPAAISETPADPLAKYFPVITYAVEAPEVFPAGEYEIGSDISSGEYFFCAGEMMEPDNIEINGESCLSRELYSMNIELEEGDMLFTKYSFISADIVDPIQPVNGVLISGKYKIGKDIAPGRYSITTLDKEQQGRCYFILDGEIGEDAIFDESDTILVPDEGYVVAYNSMIIVDPDKAAANAPEN